jgi:hypothetical protein
MSLLFHVVVLLVLALVTFGPAPLSGLPLLIDVGTAVVEADVAIDASVELIPADAVSATAIDPLPAEVAAGDLPFGMPPPDSSAALDVVPDTSRAVGPDLPAVDVLMEEFSRSQAVLGVAAAPAKPDRPRWPGFTPREPTAPREGISAAVDAAGAAEGIASTIGGEIGAGQLYVVWLLDASISLVEDRKVLADTLAPFFRQYRPEAGKQGQLITSVVAYGAGAQRVAEFSPLGSDGTIRRLPIDPSGRENVMSAVVAVVSDFQVTFHRDPRRRDRLRIVIWTDESGDDTSLLEEVIALCRATGTVVHIVGPSSVLGSDRGVQPWFDKRSKGTFLLPVTRGPDSYLTERVLLPYWFDIDADAGDYEGVLAAEGRQWYGGPLRESLLAGVGPYALTRLALQTGGTFRLLDRPGEDRRFDLAKMKDYLPEYGSAAEIVEPILASPFRLGILQAVRKTYDGVNVAPPRMDFVAGRRETTYPFRLIRGTYYAQADFRQRLPRELAEQENRIRQAAVIAEEALKCFGPSLDWEYEYSKETSRRWQAWYDLTRGRLLAMSIRYQEYLATCALVRHPGALAPPTNQINFRPGPQLRGAEEAIRNRREEAICLLERCRDRNRGTPWELLAEWELAIPLGIGFDQTVVTPPPPGPPSTGRPQLTFPSL